MKFNFKLIILGFIFLYAIITLVFFNFYKKLAIKDVREKATSTINSMNSLRAYIGEIQRPTIYSMMEHDSINGKYFDPKLLSSSHVTKYVYDKQFQNNEVKYEYKIVSDNPLNKENKASKKDEIILNMFRENKSDEYFEIIRDGRDSYFYLAKPIERNKSSCLQCHGHPEHAPAIIRDTYGIESGFNEKVGDLRAMIYVKLAVKDILSYHKSEFIAGGIAMFIVFIIFIILLYVIFKKDQTLRIRKENLFQHQNRLAVMGSIIGDISHQWKQPLTHLSYILVNIDLMNERNKLTKEKLNLKLNDANEQISFMSHTMNDFKDFFSPKKVQTECKVEETLKKSVKLWETSLSKHKIIVEFDIRNDFVLEMPQNEIIQVFINIINNAKDAFISNEIEKRVIILRAYSFNNKNIIELENNGGNIKEKVIKKIFKPYFSTKDLSVATGIGLYISQVIVNNNKGELSVENIKDGVIFKIVF